MLARRSVAHIFGNLWILGKRTVVLSLAQSVLLNNVSLAAPISPPRPGAIAPSPASYRILKAAPSVPAGTTLPPGTIPASVIASILSGANSTNLTSTIIDVSSLSNATLNLGASNLVNLSSLYFVSSNQNIHNVVVKAQNIYNAPGALISTHLPPSEISGSTPYNSSLSLSLIASNSILNAGTISSSGALSLTAQRIINALPDGISPNVRPTISAIQSVNFLAPEVINSGTISSAQANVTFANVSAGSVQSILLNNTNGIVQALNGAINFRDASFVDKFNTDIIGGDFFAKNLVINSGDGIITVSVNDISLPILDIYGGDVAVTANSSLNLGEFRLTGDPIIHSGLDVFLIKDEKTGNTNAPLIVLSERDIINISCTQIVGGFGDIIYEAGRNIDLSGITSITSKGTISLDANGGNLVVPASISSSYKPSYFPPNGEAQGLIDFSVGLFAKHSVTANTISSPEGTVSVRAGGDLIGDLHQPGTNPGDINIASIIGARDTLLDAGGGSITADSLLGAGGRMWVLAKDGVKIGSISNAGRVFDGFYQSDNRIQGSTISIGSIVVSSASTLIFSIGNINIGNISAPNSLGFGSYFNATSLAGNISYTGGQITCSSGYLELSAANGTIDLGNVTVNGDAEHVDRQGGSVNIYAQTLVASELAISCNGLGTGSGGGIKLVGNESLAVATSKVQLSANGGESGDGGAVFIKSGSGLSISSDRFSVTAGINGNGGAITLDASSLDPNNKLVVVGPLNADGNGNGNGGTITLVNGQNDFVLGVLGGVSSVSAQSGNSAGNGGSIFVESGGSLTVNANAVAAAARGETGDGGNLVFVAGMQGDPNGNNSTFDGTLSVKGALNVDGKGEGSGGSIFLINGKSQFTVGGAGSNVSQVYARSGLLGGNGGNIAIQSGGDLIINGSALNVSVRGEQGLGGTLVLSAGKMANSTFTGDLVVNGSLHADGKGAGDGGRVILNSYFTEGDDGGGIGALASVASFSGPISSNGSLYLNGNVTADAGTNGTGGTINLRAERVPAGTPDGSASIFIGDDTAKYSLFARGGSAQGDGGNIDIWSNGSLNLRTSSINASARLDGSGGTISIIQAEQLLPIETQNNPVMFLNGNFFAKGAGGGNGGTITIANSSGSSDFGALSPTRFSVTGKNGGTLSVNEKMNLLVSEQTILEASALPSADVDGSGGKVSLVVSEILTMKGDISANAVQSGSGGAIALNSNELLLGSTTHQSQFNANSSKGLGGQISITGTTQVFFVDSAINAKNTIGGVGGTITISGDRIVDGGGAIINGDGAQGGTVVISGSEYVLEKGKTSIITVDSKTGDGSNSIHFNFHKIMLDGDLILSADSNSGVGGRITLSASTTLGVGSGSLSAIVDGNKNASGGSIDFNVATMQNTDSASAESSYVRLSASGSGSGQFAGNITVGVGDLAMSLGYLYLEIDGRNKAGSGNANLIVNKSEPGEILFADNRQFQNGCISVSAQSSSTNVLEGVNIQSAQDIRILSAAIRGNGVTAGSGTNVRLSTTQSVSFVAGELPALDLSGAPASKGNGGELSITASALSVEGIGNLVISLRGGIRGNGGQLNVSTASTVIRNGVISTEAGASLIGAHGGAIYLNGSAKIELSSGSLISSAVGKNSNAGNITLSSPLLEFLTASTGVILNEIRAESGKGAEGAAVSLLTGSSENPFLGSISIGSEYLISTGSQQGKIVLNTESVIANQQDSNLILAAQNVDMAVVSATGVGSITADSNYTGTSLGGGNITLLVRNLDLAATLLRAVDGSGGTSNVLVKESIPGQGIIVHNLVVDVSSTNRRTAGDVSISSTADLELKNGSITGVAGTGGKVNISSPQGKLTLDGFRIESSKLGFIKLEASTIQQDGQVEIFADSVSNNPGGTVIIRSLSSGQDLNLGGEGKNLIVTADGGWTNRTEPSILIESAGKLDIGQSSISSSSKYNSPATKGGWVKLVSKGADLVTNSSEISANGNDGLIDVDSGGNITIDVGSSLNARGVNKDALGAQITLNTPLQSGRVDINGAILANSTTIQCASVNTKDETINSAKLQLNGASSLKANLQGRIIGSIYVDAPSSINLEFGGNATSIDVSHASSNEIRISEIPQQGVVFTLNLVSDPTSSNKVLLDSVGTVTLSAGSLNLGFQPGKEPAASSALGSNFTSVRAQKLDINQTGALDGTSRPPSVRFGANLQGNSISITAKTNILEYGPVTRLPQLQSNSITLSAEGSIGLGRFPIQTEGSALRLEVSFSGIFYVENKGNTELRTNGGVVGVLNLVSYGSIDLPLPLGTGAKDALSEVSLKTLSASDVLQTTITSNGIKSSASIEIETALSGDIINASNYISTGRLILTSTSGNVHGGTLTVGQPLAHVPLSGTLGGIEFDFTTLPFYAPYVVDAKVIDVSTGRGGLSQDGSVGTGGNVYVYNTSSSSSVARLNAGASLRLESAGFGDMRIAGPVSLSGPAVIDSLNGNIRFANGSILAGGDTVISAAALLSASKSQINTVRGNLEIIAGTRVSLDASVVNAVGAGEDNKGNVYFGIAGQQGSNTSLATNQDNIVVQGTVLWGTKTDSKGNSKPVVTGVGSTNFLNGLNRQVVFDANQLQSFVLKNGSQVGAFDAIPIAFSEFVYDSKLYNLDDDRLQIWTEDLHARAFHHRRQGTHFENGTFYFYAKRNQEIYVGSRVKLSVKGGSFLQICASPIGISVCNLADQSRDSVKVKIGGMQVCLNPGHMLFSKPPGGSTSIRQERTLKGDLHIAELSIPSLLMGEKTLRRVLNVRENKYLKTHVLKTAAAIAMLSNNRGAYAKKVESEGK